MIGEKMSIPTIQWTDNRVKIIDQNALPDRLKFIYCNTVKDIWRVIKKLNIRGAPAIGIAGAFGMYLGITRSKTKTFVEFYKEAERSEKYLASSRPTARNLFWALERMRGVAIKNCVKEVGVIKKLMLNEAKRILKEDKVICRSIGKAGSGLIKKGDTILTHCNAGGLATADFGTALAVIFQAKKDRKKVHVFVDETRPVLQGARLTSWELLREGIDTTLICDNMAASLMAKGKIDKIIVGADRIARNGDVANKIGTYNLAVLAKAHKIPFYVAAPLSTFDFNISSGKEIVIEERSADEVRRIRGKYIAPKEIKVYNPAFDVTPNRLVTAIVTEKGIVRSPYRESIRRVSTQIRNPNVEMSVILNEVKDLILDSSSPSLRSGSSE